MSGRGDVFPRWAYVYGCMCDCTGMGSFDKLLSLPLGNINLLCKSLQYLGIPQILSIANLPILRLVRLASFSPHSFVHKSQSGETPFLRSLFLDGKLYRQPAKIFKLASPSHNVISFCLTNNFNKIANSPKEINVLCNLYISVVRHTIVRK